MASNKKNIILRMQDWIESIPGQTFLNYAYSWGAAVVILGALFKLTHLPGANAMLFIGMGTEVLVFIISGFDRPAEVKAHHKAAAAESYNEKEEEEEWNDEEEEEWDSQEHEENQETYEPLPQSEQPAATQPGTGTTIIVGQTAPQTNGTAPEQIGTTQSVGQPVVVGAPVVLNGTGAPAQTQTTTPTENQEAKSTEPANANALDLKALAEMVNASNAELLSKVLEEARNSCTPGMKEAGEAYVEELKTLTDVLTRVAQQAELMTRDSQEMDNLNRTLTGINTIYEMQLKSISTQVSTIDQINDQTRKMAAQIEELNAIYKRMIQAMTINMQHTSLQ